MTFIRSIVTVETIGNHRVTVQAGYHYYPGEPGSYSDPGSDDSVDFDSCSVIEIEFANGDIADRDDLADWADFADRAACALFADGANDDALIESAGDTLCNDEDDRRDEEREARLEWLSYLEESCS